MGGGGKINRSWMESWCLLALLCLCGTGLLTQLAHHDTMMSSYHELKEDSGGCQCEPGSIYCPVDIDGSPRLVCKTVDAAACVRTPPLPNLMALSPAGSLRTCPGVARPVEQGSRRPRRATRIRHRGHLCTRAYTRLPGLARARPCGTRERERSKYTRPQEPWGRHCYTTTWRRVNSVAWGW
jgi:hypothetical protein